MLKLETSDWKKSTFTKLKRKDIEMGEGRE